ncbi:MAG: hypothetical protein EVA29_00600 [Candidatus Actinomarinales bacterium]|nr:MAG: hypothetical protein EVA29_00600 [Candidatus Actinomarinales bacterium]
MDKLRFLPHKNLFYFGFLLVLIFLALSYWQFNRHQVNESFTYDESNQRNIQLEQINELENNSFVALQGAYSLVDYYKLRSRVQNGISGYHVVAIYKDQDNLHLTVNHGWIPLENNLFKLGNFSYGFDGFLLNYDIKSPVGQEDITDSEYIFRIDKTFLEIDQNITLTDKYIHLSINCGTGIECAQLDSGYEPPHMSYSIQWLFFALCLSIVILRKNKLI